MWRVILTLFVALTGFWFGRVPEKQKALNIYPEKEFPMAEHKSFVIVMYAYNQALWCERALRSVFEQEYDHYRVVLIDDGSTDGTSEKASQFIADNNQSKKATLIRNEAKIGKIACLYRAVDSCLDREIVIPLDAKDWMSSPSSLSCLNIAYQNPDVWLTFSPTIDYPSYEIGEADQPSFYALLFKKISLEDFFKKGHFAMNPEVYLAQLVDLSEGKTRKLQEPIAFFNRAIAH